MKIRMTTNVDDAGSENVYDLACTDCDFEVTVEGDLFDALDVAESHETERGGSGTMEHFVNLELRTGE